MCSFELASLCCANAARWERSLLASPEQTLPLSLLSASPIPFWVWLDPRVSVHTFSGFRVCKQNKPNHNNYPQNPKQAKEPACVVYLCMVLLVSLNIQAPEIKNKPDLFPPDLLAVQGSLGLGRLQIGWFGVFFAARGSLVDVFRGIRSQHTEGFFCPAFFCPLCEGQFPLCKQT